LKIDIEKNDAKAYALLSVSVTKEDYYPEFQKQLKQYGKNVNLKGFRPGKIPPSVIRSMYGKSVVMEVFNQTISDKIEEYLEENKLVTLLQPQMKGDSLTPEQLLRFNDEHKFEMEICYLPPIALKASDISANSYTPTPSEKDVDKELEKLLERMESQEPVEEVEKGDFISGTFTQESTNFEETTLLPTNQIASEAIGLFLGKKKEDTVTFDLRTAFPEDATLKNLFYKDEETTAGLTGEFLLTIQEVQRKKKPELNQAFFDSALGEGEADSEETFREKYKARLVEEFDKPVKILLENELQEKLLEEVEIDFDEEFLTRLVISLNDTEIPADELQANVDRFRDFLKWKAITSYFFKEGNLTIEDSDVKSARRKEVSNRLGGIALDQFGDDFIDDLSKRMSEEKGSDFNRTVLDSAVLQKVMEYFIENATVTHESKSLAELETIFDEFSEKQKAKIEAAQPQAEVAAEGAIEEIEEEKAAE